MIIATLQTQVDKAKQAQKLQQTAIRDLAEKTKEIEETVRQRENEL